MLKKRRGIYYFKKTINGKTVEKSLRTTNKDQAQRLAGKWLDDVYAGNQGWDQSTTFAQWWVRFEKTFLPAMGKSAQTSYRRVFKLVEQQWGSTPLSKITPEECAAYIPRRINEGAPVNTIIHERGLLRAIFNRAVQARVLVRSPWVIKQSLKMQPRERVLSFEEQEKLFAIMPPSFVDVVRFLLWTGLRVDEFVRAQVKDIVQLPAPSLRVKGKGGKIRAVRLDAETVALAKKVLPAKHRPKAYLRRLHRYSKKAEIAPVTNHDLRRTFGTRCAEAGMPMPTLQKLMGHSNIQTTATFYLHVSEESGTAALTAVRRGERPGEQGNKAPNEAMKLG
jgi:integrase